MKNLGKECWTLFKDKVVHNVDPLVRNQDKHLLQSQTTLIKLSYKSSFD